MKWFKWMRKSRPAVKAPANQPMVRAPDTPQAPVVRALRERVYAPSHVPMELSFLMPSPRYVPTEAAHRAVLAGQAPAHMMTDNLVFENVNEPLSLPEGLTLQSLVLRNCPGLTRLPSGLMVGSLELSDCDELTDFPEDFWATRLLLRGCRRLQRPQSWLHVGAMRMERSHVVEFAGGLSVSDGVMECLDCRELERLPMRRMRNLSLHGCSGLRRLPDRFEVEGLDLSGCVGLDWQEFALVEVRELNLADCVQLTSLPPWLDVSESVDVANTGLTELDDWHRHCRLLWRGVPVDATVAFHPERLKPEDVLAQENAEVRRVMLERVGLERFFSELPHDVLDSDRDKGGARQLLRVDGRGREDLQVLMVKCPSTGRRYFLRVPPWVETCRAAAAWIAGFNNPDDYQPVAES